jgi:hypothetical protein
MGGHVRPGAWTAVDVLVENDGPSVTGELLIRGPQQGQSRYGVDANVPNGARQRYTLYAQTALFGSRLNVDLVNGTDVLATQQVKITSHDAYTPIVAIIAEQPQKFQRDIQDALVNPNIQSSTVITLQIGDLPSRVEAWSAIDRLVWQDVDAANLTTAQILALRLWLGAGGRLTVIGGTTGNATMRGFNREDEVLLPFDPTKTVDIEAADIAALTGTPPTGATGLPSIAGPLDHGTILARHGDDVIAAEAVYGRGAITLIGFDPGTSWISESDAAGALWHRLMPQPNGAALNPLAISDDSQIVYALQNLPSVDLPPIEQLFVLLIAYIALVGPINYLVLRRLGRREWAWITIPALALVFAAGSFGLGATLKGSDVIVNQITVVRAAQGTGRGIGQAYIGIYSPSRRSFDVRIPGGALLSNPTSQQQTGQVETPLDVVFGETSSRLRNFEVGFGVLRGFRAEAPADAPQVDSDLHLERGVLLGTVTNRSVQVLENVAVVYSGGAAVLGTLEPGASKEIELDVKGSSFINYALSEVIFGTTFPRDAVAARAVQTRRSVIDQLFPWGTQGAAEAPLLLAWANEPVLEVDLTGETPNRVGDGLFMIPFGLRIDSQQIFSDQLMHRTIVETSAANAWGDQGGMYLSRGTMTVETRPSRFDGSFTAASLEVAMTQGDARQLNGHGEALSPLPTNEQPPQDDPLEKPDASPSPGPSTSPDPSASPPPTDDPDVPPPDLPGKPGFPDVNPFDTLPDFQLLDRTTGLWMEFAHPSPSKSYLITDPQKYVDSTGTVMFRFINRSDAGQFGEDQRYFQLLVRVEGTIQ